VGANTCVAGAVSDETQPVLPPGQETGVLALGSSLPASGGLTKVVKSDSGDGGVWNDGTKSDTSLSRQCDLKRRTTSSNDNDTACVSGLCLWSTACFTNSHVFNFENVFKSGKLGFST
jgi:hypothetical protein